MHAEKTTAFDWESRAFCKCGFSHRPSFGSIFFTRCEFPVCPDCGESSYGFEMKTVRWIRTGRWWSSSGYWEFRALDARARQESAE